MSNVPVHKSTEELKADFDKARAAVPSVIADRVIQGLPLDKSLENCNNVRNLRQAWSALQERRKHS